MTFSYGWKDIKLNAPEIGNVVLYLNFSAHNIAHYFLRNTYPFIKNLLGFPKSGLTV